MFKILLRWLVRAALCTSAFAAQAQGAGSPPTAPAARPDPLDAKASVPALTYRSSLAHYRGFSDDKPLSWREANDAVARIGQAIRVLQSATLFKQTALEPST